MDLTSEQLAILTMHLLARQAEMQLKKERKDGSSLRKALLVHLALTQESWSSAARQYAETLLTEFRPLTKHGKRHEYDLWSGHSIAVRQDDKGDVQLAISHDFVDSLLESFGELNASEVQTLVKTAVNASAEGHTPMHTWTATTDRYVAFLDIMGFGAMIAKCRDDHARPPCAGEAIKILRQWQPGSPIDLASTREPHSRPTPFCSRSKPLVGETFSVFRGV